MKTLDQITNNGLETIYSKQYAQAFSQWLRAPDPANAQRLLPVGSLSEQRAMGVSTPSAGGYLAPEGFSKEVWKRMTATSPMRAVSTVSEVLGVDAGFPFVDDSASVGRILAENTAATETDLTISLKKLPAYMFSSDILRCSLQFLQDAGPEQIEEFLLDSLSERIARGLNLAATTGSGANQPQGIVTAATVGVSGATGQTTSVTWDDLVDLVASVPEPYVYGEDGIQNTGRWMMNGATFQFCRKLKDGEGAPLWTPDPTGRTAGALLGHRVAINPDMPSMTASAKAIIFGLLSVFAIRDGATVVRTYSERYAEFGQVGFQVFSRHGAGLVDPNGIRAYQCAAA